MKAVIPAAGMGTRLRPMTEDLPKGLIPIGGKTLLEHSLDILDEKGVHEVIIIVGFHGQQIKDKLGNQYKSVKIRYAENKRYSETGSMFSLSQIKDIIDDDILLLESDLIYEPAAIIKLLKEEKKNVTLVTEFSGSGDEVYICTDGEGRITQLGKQIPEDKKKEAVGEFIGISKLSKEFLNEVFEKAEDDYSKGEENYHYEECLFETNKIGSPFYAIVAKDLTWTEIDNENDLKRAKEVIYPKIKHLREQ